MRLNMRLFDSRRCQRVQIKVCQQTVVSTYSGQVYRNPPSPITGRSGQMQTDRLCTGKVVEEGRWQLKQHR